MGYKDLAGEVKIAAQWDQVKSFGYKAGLLASVSGSDTAPARVRKGYKWGLISETGDILLPCEYDEISFGVYSKRAFFELINYYPGEEVRIEKGLADISGDLLFPPSNEHLRGIYDGVARFTDGIGGEILRELDLKKWFDQPDTPIANERTGEPEVKVNVVGGCLMDMDGNALTERFNHISRFFYNRAYVEQKSRSGVIDTEGNFIVPLTSKLKRITTFKEGYAECQVKTKEGYVDGVIDLWGGVKDLGEQFNPLYPAHWERQRCSSFARH